MPTQHTPTPWHYSAASYNLAANNKLIASLYPNLIGTPIDNATCHANGEFIVRACNAHEELLAELKIEAEYRRAAVKIAGALDNLDAIKSHKERLAKLVAAIAKAEGK